MDSYASYLDDGYTFLSDLECKIEDLGDYRVGGFHPVHLGDTFENARYRIIHKLGNGGFATVWLARDQQLNRYVALKIITARASSEACKELRILKYLATANAKHPGRAYISWFLDHFWTKGTNGSHLCFVMEVVGPQTSICAMRKSLAMSPKHVRESARQVSQGLEFLHASGIGHGDLRPSNVLFQLRDFDRWTEAEVFERLGEPDRLNVIRLAGGEPGPHLPSYAVFPVTFDSLDPCHLTHNVKIVDFGISFFLDDPPKRLGTPFQYTSPELVIDSRVSASADVWALACTIFEIRTRSTLFSEFCSFSENEAKAEIVALLGKLPEPWWQDWNKRDKFFDDEGHALGSLFNRAGIKENLFLGFADPLPEDNGMRYAERVKETDFEEIDLLDDLLSKILTFTPEGRITVTQTLEHPWFQMDVERANGVEALQA